MTARVLVVALALGAGCQIRREVVENTDAFATTNRGGSGGADGQAGAQGGGPGGAGGGPGVGGGAGGNPGDGGDTPMRQEECNGLDDDGDMVVDNGYDLTKDPTHCGRCDNVCKYAHAVPLCVASACQRGECVAGFFDANKDAKDGCECTKSNAGIEICDGIDNNCDGTVDDGFDLATDLANCGTCGRTCAYFNATTACEMGACKLVKCLDNFYDLDKDPTNGCEIACIKSGAEVCDGFDNDCDGMADNGTLPGVGAACGPPQAGTGECKPGTQSCTMGVLVCSGGTFPMVEACDLKDNDCDGTTDNGFDKMNDPLHCGGCTACPPGPQVSVAGCALGACTIAVCQTGWNDTDGMVSNGCENNCPMSGPEICDGVDNDCDGKTDDTDADLVYPANFCVQIGECGKGPGTSPRYPENTFPECKKIGAAAPDWICNYPATVGLLAPNLLSPTETLCDGLDNNCDAATDEPFPDKGTACFDTGIGACRRMGSIQCTADQLSTSCVLPPGPPPAPGPELCNGIDDDCDNVVDNITATNGYDDKFVLVGGVTFFAQEASRPDATGASAGGVNAPRPCSLPGKLPWSNVTKEEAAAACAAVGSGWRLCTPSEWENACKGPAASIFPYGNTYVGGTCNGADYPDVRTTIPTGEALMCKSDFGTGLFDMSGNVREWVQTGASYEMRGGAYSTLSYTINGVTTAPGLRCDARIAAPSTPLRLPTVGFRCCHTGAFP